LGKAVVGSLAQPFNCFGFVFCRTITIQVMDIPGI
jgi:hypothetical protein